MTATATMVTTMSATTTTTATTTAKTTTFDFCLFFAAVVLGHFFGRQIFSWALRWCSRAAFVTRKHFALLRGIFAAFAENVALLR